MRNVCTIDGCERSVYGRGWCNLHWQRWRKWGDPTYRLLHRNDPVARLMQKVNKVDSGCWEWTGTMSSDGYGRFAVGRSTTTAHRAAYSILVVPVPADLEVDHLCRNRRCVNPEHLEPVTRTENRRRQARCGRCPKGHVYEDHGVYVGWDGKVRCKPCHKEREAERRRRNKAA